MARRLLTRHPLRTGDAIQLACGLPLQDALGQTLDGFVCYDERLLAAARAESMPVETASPRRRTARPPATS